jgi:hypothetical protein
MTSKPHPLKGRKKSAATIAKMKATLAEKKRMREAGLLPKQQKRKSPRSRFATRTLEALERDAKEALWCIDRAVAGTRRKIQAGELSLTDVTDEETFMYMAKRYLEGGLKP